MTFNATEYMIAIGQKEKPRNWRYGQFLFNTLYDMYPEVANEIRGTDKDPFYADKATDERVQKFFKYLYKGE